MKPSFYYSIAAIAIVLSLIELVFLFYSTGGLGQLTGFSVTSTATTNISVTATAAINFTTNIINWGTGTVNLGANQAVLDTSSGSTTNGSWGTQTAGFILQNIGNVNVSLTLNTASNASTFIGGTLTTPGYFYNVTNSDLGSCNQTTSTFPLATYYTANTTATLICDKFYFASANNSLRIDIRLIIPSDSRSGVLGDTMTATAAQV